MHLSRRGKSILRNPVNRS